MKKYFYLLFLVFILSINVSFSEELANKLESASLQILDMNVNLSGANNAALKATFILKNKTSEVLKTKMNMRRIHLTDGHMTEFCYGECTFFPSEFDPDEMERTTSQFDLEPNSTTDPNTNSYIKMKPDGVDGQDTIVYKIFNLDDPENDFVQFVAVWNFGNVSIKELNTSKTPININVYPNPTTNLLYINTDNKNIDAIELYDIAGNLVQQEQILNYSGDNTNNTCLVVNTLALKNGAYVGYLIKNKNKISMFRFVK